MRSIVSRSMNWSVSCTCCTGSSSLHGYVCLKLLSSSQNVCVKRLTSLSDEIRSFVWVRSNHFWRNSLCCFRWQLVTHVVRMMLMVMCTMMWNSFLDLAFRLLTCPIFAKRMQGAENLDLWIRRTTRQSANDYDDSEDSDFEIDTTTASTRKSRYPRTWTAPRNRVQRRCGFRVRRNVSWEIMLSSYMSSWWKRVVRFWDFSDDVENLLTIM